MDSKHIAAVLAALTGLTATTLTPGCDKSASGATEVPGARSDGKADEAAEHACGNHAEGADGGNEPAAAQPVPHARSFDVAPGKFAEVNFHMKKGASVTATFAEGSAHLAWDVHSHDHVGATTIHAEGTGGTGKVSFTAPEDGVFSILWKNGGATISPLKVSVSLEQGASIHSWVPAE